MAKEEYVKPDYNLDRYTCPYCGIFCKQKEIINKDYSENWGSWGHNIRVIVLLCEKCSKRTVWEVESFSNGTSEKELLKPNISSIDENPNQDMTDEEKKLFNESKDIFDKSPKSAGALLRCVLESILKRCFPKIEKNKTLGQMLNCEEIKNELDEEFVNFLIGLKNIGNQSAHSSLLIYEDDDKKSVKPLFEAINIVVDELISSKKRKEKLFKSIENNKLNVK